VGGEEEKAGWNYSKEEGARRRRRAEKERDIARD